MDPRASSEAPGWCHLELGAVDIMGGVALRLPRAWWAGQACEWGAVGLALVIHAPQGPQDACVAFA